MYSQDTLILIFEKLFFGFGMSVLLVLLLSLSKSENIKEFCSKFVQYAIVVIRILGIIYFFYYLVSTIAFYTTTEKINFLSERATGPYAWAYWMMFLRPFLFCLLVQLFWLNKIKNSKRRVFILTLIIFFLVLASGPNLERFVILLTTYHRGYLPSSEHLGPMSDNTNFVLVYVLLWLENTLLFSGVVFATWFLTERIKNIN